MSHYKEEWSVRVCSVPHLWALVAWLTCSQGNETSPNVSDGSWAGPNSLHSHASKLAGTVGNAPDSFTPWSTRSRKMRVQILQKCWESLVIFFQKVLWFVLSPEDKASHPVSSQAVDVSFPFLTELYNPVCFTQSRLDLFKRFQILPQFALPSYSALVWGLFHPLVLPRAKSCM